MADYFAEREAVQKLTAKLGINRLSPPYIPYSPKIRPTALHEAPNRPSGNSKASISEGKAVLQPAQQLRYAQNGHTPPQVVAAGQQTELPVDPFQTPHEGVGGPPAPFYRSEWVFYDGLSARVNLRPLL